MHIRSAQSDLTFPEISQDFMQTQPLESITSVFSTEASESQIPTTQDGFHPYSASSSNGCSQLRSRSLSPSSIAAGSDLAALGAGAHQLDKVSRRLSGQDGRATLPGERISAYENAVTPNMQQTMGFKVIKRSGPPSDGPSLTDCPNGMLPISPLTVWPL